MVAQPIGRLQLCRIVVWTLFQDRPPLARSPVDNAQFTAGFVHETNELVAARGVFAVLLVGGLNSYHAHLHVDKQALLTTIIAKEQHTETDLECVAVRDVNIAHPECTLGFIVILHDSSAWTPWQRGAVCSTFGLSFKNTR